MEQTIKTHKKKQDHWRGVHLMQSIKKQKCINIKDKDIKIDG